MPRQSRGAATRSWADRYAERRPQYERFCHRLQALLVDVLSAAHIDYQVVESRAKDVKSFEEKLRREGRVYTDPFEEITDFAGLRVILNYVSDVERVSDLISREFRVDPERSVDKRRALAIDQFGYLSVHWIVRLSATRAELPEWQGLGELVAEIQVRTVVQHSWAAISHALQYKREGEVPEQFRRRLVRLAGLLELADEEFEALRVEEARLRERASHRITSGKLNIPVNAFSAIEFTANSVLVREFAESAIAAGMRMDHPSVGDSEDQRGDDKGVSQLVRACKIAGAHTVLELEQILQRVRDHVPEFLRAFMEQNADRHRKENGGSEIAGNVYGSPAHVAAMVVAAAADPKPSAKAIAQRLGWGRGYADTLISVAPLLLGEGIAPSA